MRRVLLVLGALGLLAASAQPAFAGTTVGETFQPDSSGATCNVNPGQEWNVLQTARASGPSYAVPSAGVLTSWSFESAAAGASDTVMNMRVFRPTGTPQEYTAVADGSPLQTIANGSGLNSFPTRIPVHAGDYVGIRSTSGVCAHNTGNPADTADHYFTAPLAIGVPQAFIEGPNFIWDVSAVLEPDADQDGYGDETQDQCPTDASTHGPCPVAPVTPGTSGTPSIPTTPKKKCKKRQKPRSSAFAAKKCKKKPRR
jgi:hypothetical protein